MKRLIQLGLISTLACCNSPSPHTPKTEDIQTPEGRSFPAVVELKDLKQTVFVPTLESKLTEGKNAIYASSLLFAWDKIKGLLKHPIVLTDSNTTDLHLVNSSTSHLYSLQEGEYEAEAHLEDDAIVATAYFHKSLPFPVKFDRLQDPILFQGQKVSSFGMEYYHGDIADCIRILYYKNDSNFVIELIPTDREHQIVLARGLSEAGSLAEMAKQMQVLINAGSTEKKDTSLLWKYEVTEEDKLAIPVIKFNLSTHYEGLEGQKFKSNNEPHIIVTVYQRTALIFDEYGAEVESEAYAVCDSIGIPMEKEKPHPKNFIFDGPYFMALYRIDSKNPYFAMKVNNTELMTAK